MDGGGNKDEKGGNRAARRRRAAGDWDSVNSSIGDASGEFGGQSMCVAAEEEKRSERRKYDMTE